jgi:hypothetical protein
VERRQLERDRGEILTPVCVQFVSDASSAELTVTSVQDAMFIHLPYEHANLETSHWQLDTWSIGDERERTPEPKCA